MSEKTSTAESSPLRWYLLEACNAVATLFLTNSIYFYTEQRLGWSAFQNLLLAAGVGAVYIVTSLTSHAVCERLGKPNTLRLMWALSALFAILPLFFTGSAVLAVLMLLYTFTSGMPWPVLESLVTVGTNPEQMSRRLGLYNLTWAGCSAVAMVVVGWMIDYAPAGVFIVPCVVNVISLIGVGRTGILPVGSRTSIWPVSVPSPEVLSVQKPPHPSEPPILPTVEPELMAIRKLALWLSRICMPSTYVVIFSLLAILPSLPVLSGLNTMQKTLMVGILYATRWLTFLVLGHTVWWHARPRLLLLATGGMLFAYLGSMVPASTWFGNLPGGALDLTLMAFWLAVLGVCLGVIYTSSLYFGMVLSNGSTEHGGYHEALIGVGWAVGPAIAAGASCVSNNPLAGVFSVACVVGLSLLAAGVASVKLGREIDVLRSTFAEDLPTERGVVIRNE